MFFCRGQAIKMKDELKGLLVVMDRGYSHKPHATRLYNYANHIVIAIINGDHDMKLYYPIS